MNFSTFFRYVYIIWLVMILSLQAHSDESEQHSEFLKVEKQRVIVLTDITNEPDDQESLVRFLVYSNEYNVEALIATTSTWLRNNVRPDKIIDVIEAYGKVQNNLQKHAQGYLSKEQLLSVVTEHLPEYGMKGVGDGKSSDGSRRIIEVVDREDPRPVWVSVWGGANCLAQALWDVRKSHTPDEVAEFISKLRVYTISDQDDSGRWMRLEFPDLFYIVSPSNTQSNEYYKATWTGISGDRHYRNGPMYKFELVDNPWLEENIIKTHGPLGAMYPKLEYIMEGDTPSFFNLIINGLGSALSPAYGGWGGRYHLCKTYAETRAIWTNTRYSRDTVELDNGITYKSEQATIWRWREAYQYDFAARMDWCVAERYEDANHNPVVILNGDTSKDVLKMIVKSDDTISLSASGTYDPDGDTVRINWWVYREAGSYNGGVNIGKTNTEQLRFTAPQVREPSDIHIICEAKDNSEPNLYSYRRTIIRVIK